MLSKVIFFMAALLLISAADNSSNWQKFCSEIPSWKKGQTVPESSAYKGVGHVIDAKLANEKRNEEGWVMIDARLHSDRETAGGIPKALLITADPTDASKHEFTEPTILRKVNEHFALLRKLSASKRLTLQKDFHTKEYKSASDLANLNFVIFCNGPKCHRTSWGACSLRQMGIQEEKIHLLLGGFPAWTEAGYPVTPITSLTH